MTATIGEEAADLRRANAELRRRLDERTAERDEAQAQKAAIAEVLGIINASPGDLAPVFDAMLEKAMRLCDAAFGSLLTYDGENFHAAALRSVPGGFADYLRRPLRPEPESALGRVISDLALVHLVDAAAQEAYRNRSPLVVAGVELGGVRTLVAVPLLKADKLLGVFHLYRQEVRPFSDKQIALLQNFAAQAEIAMENARLITETREALEQQTATTEVLQVINSSPGDLAPVFDAMLEKATRLCEAAFGILNTYDDERFRTVTLRGVPRPLEEFLLQSEAPPPTPNSPPGRIIGGEDVVHVDDLAVLEGNRDSRGRAMVELGGARSYVTVSLRKDGRLLGTIAAYRQQVRPFSDNQIALLRNFAAQAVIAMENARLITETREALEQQTATAEVLQVINGSPGDLAPVFDAMLEKAMRLCEASFGYFMSYDGDAFETLALRGVPVPFAEFLGRGPLRPSAQTGLGRIVDGAPLVHVADLAAEDAYRLGDPVRVATVDLGGARTWLAAALVKDNVLLGVFMIYRQEVRSFSDKQIALLQNFAAQAVIAMENARLITETREALEQQTATAEVLQVINASPGDLAPVFDAMLEKALTLCGATYGGLAIFDGECFHPAASRGNPEYVAWLRQHGPIRPTPGSTMARIVGGEDAVQITDIADDEVYRSGAAFRRALVDIGGFQTLLGIALRKDNTLLRKH